MLALPILLALAVTADSARAPRAVVCGVDRSGSAYPLRADAIYECARVLATAGPGDEVDVRWISERSYAASQRVVHLRVPASPRSCRSVMDVPCRRAYAQWVQAAAAAKQQAVSRLLAARIESAPATDLNGFLQAASETLANTPAGVAREIRIVTDGFDNIGQSIAPELHDVSVTLAMLQVENDVARALSTRAALTRFFLSHGARDVRIVAAQGASR